MSVTKAEIESIISSKIAEDGVFIVELEITANNEINLLLDRASGIDLDYCAAVNRLLNESLDLSGYDVCVSSAGIGCPLRVLGQYLKNIGNEVEVTYPNGSHKKGILVSADEEGFTYETEEREAVEGMKKKQLVKHTYAHKYNEIKQVKDIVSFK